METEVTHEADARRFVLMFDGHAGVLDYHVADGVMSITHTRVPEVIGGRGIAASLTRAAVATARGKGWKVDPVCSYARVWFQRHPQEADVLAS